MTLDVLRRIRELHTYDDDELTCCGCSGVEAVGWPCETAMLVYTTEEINETLYWHAVWSRWMHDVRTRKALASGWSMVDDLRQALIRSLSRPSPIQKLFADAKVGLDMPVVYDDD